jgi:hypothetical protein
MLFSNIVLYYCSTVVMSFYSTVVQPFPKTVRNTNLDSSTA